MTAKLSDGFLRHAAKLISSGATIKEAASVMGCNADNLSKSLRARLGFDGSINRSSRLGVNRIDSLPESEIVNRYTSGESELSLSRSFSVSRNVISRILTKNGAIRRDRSTACFVRASRMTPEERKELAKAAHEANRRSTKEARESKSRKRAKAAESRSGDGGINIGVGEQEVADALRAKGLDVTQQQAINFYNIDIRVGSVAVEVKFGAKGRRAITENAAKLEEIFEADLKPCLLVLLDRYAIDNGIDDIVTLIDGIDRKPTPLRQYWVIRSGLQTSPISRFNGNKAPLVKAPPELVTSIRQVDYG